MIYVKPIGWPLAWAAFAAGIGACIMWNHKNATQGADSHFSVVAPHEIRYKFTDLGTLRYSATGKQINDAGQVIGTSSRPGTAGVIFLWENGQIREIGTLPGKTASTAGGINRQGVIVGAADNGGDALLDPPQSLLYHDGEIKSLLPDVRSSFATSINDQNEVVGYMKMGPMTQHAFIWRNGKVVDLGAQWHGSSEAHDINNRGQIVGYAVAGKTLHTVLWENGKLRDLGTLGGESSEGQALNDQGQVVGHVRLGKKDTRAFLWHNGSVQVLDSPGPGLCSAVAINNKTQIVGDWWPENGGFKASRAVLWEGGKLYDLNTLIPASGWTLESAISINEHGQITGGARLNDQRHAFLLTPIP